MAAIIKFPYDDGFFRQYQWITVNDSQFLSRSAGITGSSSSDAILVDLQDRVGDTFKEKCFSSAFRTAPYRSNPHSDWYLKKATSAMSSEDARYVCPIFKKEIVSCMMISPDLFDDTTS